MLSKLGGLFLVLTALVPCVIGEYYSKQWALRATPAVLLATFLCYNLTTALWLPALRLHGQLSALGAIWSCLNVVTCVLLGVCVFGETLSMSQLCGMLLAILAIALLV